MYNNETELAVFIRFCQQKSTKSKDYVNHRWGFVHPLLFPFCKHKWDFPHVVGVVVIKPSLWLPLNGFYFKDNEEKKTIVLKTTEMQGNKTPDMNHEWRMCELSHIPHTHTPEKKNQHVKFLLQNENFKFKILIWITTKQTKTTRGFWKTMGGFR